MRKLIIVVATALSAVGLTFAPAAAIQNFQVYSIASGRGGATLAHDWGGPWSWLVVAVKCSGNPGPWHYGNRVYAPNDPSQYICPAGQTAVSITNTFGN